MKNLSIFELNIGFNAKAHAYGQIPRSRILHPGQSVGIATVQEKGLLVFVYFAFCFSLVVVGLGGQRGGFGSPGGGFTADASSGKPLLVEIVGKTDLRTTQTTTGTTTTSKNRNENTMYLNA